jgi:hypothetical protein
MLRVRVRGDGLGSAARIIQIVINRPRSTANAAHTLGASVVLRFHLLLGCLLLAFTPLAALGLRDALFADFSGLRLLCAVACGARASQCGRDIEAAFLVVVLVLIGARHGNLLLPRYVRGAAAARLVVAVLFV